MINEQKHRILFCSPNGSTRHISKVIESKLRELGAEVQVDEIWQNIANKEQDIMDVITQKKVDCLWVGSPVYAFHAIPPVQNLLDNLREAKKEIYAIPYVTWGGVTTGISLFEMGKTLNSKGFSILGAAKIMAVHSSMWNLSEPFGQGRPNAEDDKYITDLVEKVISKIENAQAASISLEQLDYQEAWLKKQAEEISLDKIKAMHPGFNLDKELCTQCGICVDNCPVNAISLNPYPEIDSNCILCNNCVKLCPEGAFSVDLSETINRIRGMAEKINEKPLTQTFLS